MKLLKIICRILTTPLVFFMFGVFGVFKLWKYGGGTYVNFGKEVTPHEAVNTLTELVEQAKSKGQTN